MATTARATEAPLSPLQRHDVETRITSAVGQLTDAVRMLRDSSVNNAETEVIYKCRQCGEPINPGSKSGLVIWNLYDADALVVVHKDAPGSPRCDSNYQNRYGRQDRSWELDQFLAMVAANRL